MATTCGSRCLKVKSESRVCGTTLGAACFGRQEERPLRIALSHHPSAPPLLNTTARRRPTTRKKRVHIDFVSTCTAPGFLDTEGDTNIAPPPSIVDPDATERSRFI